MSEFNGPRRGSMAYYPRVRAKKETPTMSATSTEKKPLTFLAYKVGMVQVAGKNTHKASPSFGFEVVTPATVLSTPPLKVFGIRAYTKGEIGVQVLSDVLAENTDKELMRKMPNFNKPSPKAKKARSNDKKDDEYYTVEDFSKEMNDIEYFTLLAHTQPNLIDLKKTPDISEISLGGKKEEQLELAKEKLGKELDISEVFKEKDFLDVRAVTSGKGVQGVIKRFNVRSLRPKNKKVRVVGSISPWHPHTVMFTVARPGQMGYQNRTEQNKKVLMISDKVEAVNPSHGFTGFGNVKGKYTLVYGSVPGPVKRCVALRQSLRPTLQRGIHYDTITSIIKK